MERIFVFSKYFNNRLEFATVQINIQDSIKIQDYITGKLLDGWNKNMMKAFV